jgi:hypothetical protein
MSYPVFHILEFCPIQAPRFYLVHIEDLNAWCEYQNHHPSNPAMTSRGDLVVHRKSPSLAKRDHRAKMARVRTSLSEREAFGPPFWRLGLAEVVCDEVECSEEGVHVEHEESVPFP